MVLSEGAHIEINDEMKDVLDGPIKRHDFVNGKFDLIIE